jgi:murein L,D-transpeptidase YcbB/YkuD
MFISMRAIFLSVVSAMMLLSSAPALAQGWRAAQIADLIRAAAAAPQEGLPVPEDALERVLLIQYLRDFNAGFEAALESAANELFLRLASAYAAGGVDPAIADPDWHIPRAANPDMNGLMTQLHAGGQPSVLLQGLLPASADYIALRNELARLRASPSSAENQAHIVQVLANLERWRWLPRRFPDRRIEVHLAQYELVYFDGVNSAPARYDVIVGAPRSPSPVFAATIEAVTLNPYWNPPYSIVVNELAPRFARNPLQAAREDFEVLDSRENVVDASAVNWRARPLLYHLRQRPGPQNALGRLRFDLPNPYSVYLHDTPSRSLFERTVRAFSHGCIRVKAPVALASSLLGADWSETKLSDAIATGATQTIRLANPAPVYLLYQTAIADDNGSIQYLNDVNHRDNAIAAALNARAPAITAAVAQDYETCGL